MKGFGLSRSSWVACAAVTLLLVGFALNAWFSVRGKSATYDEPAHAVGGWVVRHLHDYRISPEDPPLWRYWATLPHGADALRIDRESERWRDVPADDSHRWPLVVDALYRTPGVDGHAYINRSRGMMVLVGVALGVLLAVWGGKLGGPIGAVAAAGFFALDPNFLAHTPLVKNDVAFALIVLAVAMAAWYVGRRATWRNVTALALLLGISLGVKMSALLLFPIVGLMLGLRALADQPWSVERWTLTGRRGRLALAAGVMLVGVMVSWGMIWAIYGFRYEMAPDPQVRLNTARLIETTRDRALLAEYAPYPVPVQAYFDWQPPALVRLAVFLDDRRLVPHTWANALIFTQMTLYLRSAFLMESYGLFGWWYYFPLAMLFKTPIATQLAVVGCVLLAGWWIVRRGAMRSFASRWTLLALALPPGIYGLMALNSNVNLGLRHVLPLYPFVFLGIAWTAGVLFSRAPRKTSAGLALVLLILAAETLAAYPDYIPFFNRAAGGSRGGLALLSDSNLDWGQDLPALAVWQQANPDTPLYLAYFGLADPAFYGIRYTPLPQGYQYDPPGAWPTEPGVLAISATILQGTYVTDPDHAIYARLRHEREPLAVLGESIYLYSFDPDDPIFNTTPPLER